MRLIMTLLFCAWIASPALAGTTYQVTAKDDRGDPLTYEVSFGGGKLFEQYTAYDPKTKTFVYLQFKRGDKAPEPAATIWDHRTGKEVALYRFPGAGHPLPVIHSIKDMACCPKTGDKDFKATAIIAYD